MGVFSINTNPFSENYELSEIGMNEDYTTGVDMAIALVESRENEFAVLDAGIKQDMLAAMCEDYDERLAINEATVSGVLNKVKEILKKLLEKLKSIFHSFMAKMNSFFMDSNEFFKKYSAEIAGKNLSNFKIKARKFDYTKFTTKLMKNIAIDDYITAAFGANFKNKSDEDIQREYFDSDKLGKWALTTVFHYDAITSASFDEDLGNIAKEVEDYVFDDAEEMDNLSGSTIVTTDWIGGLISKKKFIEDIKKINNNAEKAVAKLITEIGKDITGLAGTIGNDKEYEASHHILKVDYSNTSKDKTKYEKGAKNPLVTNIYKSGRDNAGQKGTTQSERDANTTLLIKHASYEQARASKLQDCMIKAHNARLACAKKAVAQAKRIFAAAVAYNPKKESYELYTAVGESAEFEAIMAME